MKHITTMQLTNEWVILVFSTLEDVINRIDVLTNGNFKVDIKKYTDSLNTERIDFNARARMFKMRDTYIAQARHDVGEQDLDLPATFSPRPLEIGRYLVGVGNTKYIGGPSVDYVHYCYLRVPSGTTSINVKGLNIPINLNDNSVSRAIKINQMGYKLDAPEKYAYIGCHIYDFGPLIIDSTSFEICDYKTHEVVYTGSINLRDANSKTDKGKLLTGEYVYELNFSDFNLSGKFYIKVNGIGRSWDFEHSENIYGEIFYNYIRGLFHQRCGIEMRAPFTNWPRIKCHSQPVYESKFVSFPSFFMNKPKDYERFNIYGATTDLTKSTNNIQGGWHDAADWDRNTHHYTCIFDLLYAYEMNPEKFKPNQLNIPESKNIIPDILCEVDWGLMLWKRSMNSEGGISGMVETNSHPPIDSTHAYAFSMRTRWDSLLFATACAMMAEFTKPFDKSSYDRWMWYANKSYNYGINSKNSLGTITIPAKEKSGTGEYYEYTFTETEENILPFLVHAKTRMYRATGNLKFLENLDNLISKLRPPANYPYNNRDYSVWIHYSTIPFLNDLQKSFYIKRWYLDYADRICEQHKEMPYRCTWPVNKDFWMSWGASNTVNENKMLIIAYELTKNEKYLKPVTLNHDFMLGANAMGMSWTTGMGQCYPIIIQHDVSRLDNIMDPVPGTTVYGINGGMYSHLKNEAWSSIKPDKTYEYFKYPEEVPLWRTWSAHPFLNTRQCEYTIQETFASMIFSSAYLMPNNWYPTDEMKNKKPKPFDELHGYYYLP